MPDSITPDDPQKQCSKCKKFFTTTTAFFYRDSNCRDGLHSSCIACTYTRKTSPKEPPAENMKRCSKCLGEFPATSDYFQHDKTHKDGFRSHCKGCAKVTGKTRRDARSETEKEALKQHMHQYYESHKEEACSVAREYYTTRKEEVYRYKKQYREEHYHELHQPEVLRQRNLYLRERRNRPHMLKRERELDVAYAHKRRARKMQSGGNHTRDDIQRLYQEQRGCCRYCGTEFGNGKCAYHVDHVVPLSRGGSNDASNLALACPTCNLRKSSKLLHEWHRSKQSS